jgi:DNA-binding PadR family transcriptional regulator
MRVSIGTSIPVLATRFRHDPADMKLKPISYMVLGMLRLGATSGYAIKKAADASTSVIWPVSLAQVYPELARLERGGLVVRHEDPQGSRSRSRYELTGTGEEALLAWLRSTHEALPQTRIEGMLRGFFIDALPREDQIALVRRAQERFHDYRSQMYDKDLRGALADFEQGGIRGPVLLGLMGEAMLKRGEEWLAQLEAMMEAELTVEGNGDRKDGALGSGDDLDR